MKVFEYITGTRLIAAAFTFALVVPVSAEAVMTDTFVFQTLPNDTIIGIFGPQWTGVGDIVLDMEYDGTFTGGLGISTLDFNAKDDKTGVVYTYDQLNIGTKVQDLTKYTVSGGKLVSLYLNLMPAPVDFCGVGCLEFVWDRADTVWPDGRGILFPTSDAYNDALYTTVTGNIADVQIPAAGWLFMAALAGLFGQKRVQRKRTALWT